MIKRLLEFNYFFQPNTPLNWQGITKKLACETTKKQSPQTAEEAIFSQANSLEQTKTLNRMDRSLSRAKASLESEMKLDADRGVHSEYKAGRLAKVEEQISFVNETLTTQVTENVSINEEHKHEKDDLPDEKLTVQEQLNKNTENDEEAKVVSQAELYRTK